MWIIPNNYNYSRSAQDMVASREDLSLLESNLKQSLMWRSKPSQLRTWLRRWKTTSWFQHLSGRMLKPCHWKSFEKELTSSLEVIPVNHSQQQDKEKDKKILGTCFHSSSKQLMLFDPEPYSLRMSKDTSVLDSEKLLKAWKDEVTKQRGEYSQRQKWVRHIKEKGYLYWATPMASDQEKSSRKMREGKQNGLIPQVLSSTILYPTPCARDGRDDGDMRSAQNRDSPGISAIARRFPDGEASEVEIGKLHDLNPDWVEQLMGLPINWTDLGSWETE